MKVIRRGTIPADRIWRGTCTTCKSVVEAQERELHVTHDRDGPFGEVACPVCGQRMVFYPKNEEPSNEKDQ